MDLERIREITAYNSSAKPLPKHAMQAWLCGLRDQYQLAVTLTIKQTIEIKTDRGMHYRALRRDDCDAIAKRFTQKLNRQVFGNAAERHGKGLIYLPIVEGVHNSKNLHLHMAVGNFPKTFQFNQFPQMVSNAVTLVRELDEQHAVDVMDSGWLDYITKELSAKNTDNVLWQLA